MAVCLPVTPENCSSLSPCVMAWPTYTLLDESTTTDLGVLKPVPKVVGPAPEFPKNSTMPELPATAVVEELAA